MSSEHTSDIQKNIYNFIIKYMRDEGMPPTNREIGKAMNIASTGHVDYHLSMLEKKGYITRESKKSRDIKLVEDPFGIPVMGSIVAGEPLEVFSDSAEAIDVGRDIEQQGTYALVVKGQSMIEDYICDKDYVVIKPQNTCEDGDTVVAVHLQRNGRATLKRFFQEKERDRVRLQPANSEMDPIYVPKSEWDNEWQVQGKVVAIFRKSIATKSENISAILDALKVGSNANTKEDSQNDLGAGKEDYDRLTELVEGKLIGKSENELLIAKYLDQPESWQNTLKSEFEKVNIDQDKEILNAAKRVTSQFMQKDVVYDRVFSANNATQKQLDQIVEQCSKQAKQWFRYSLLAAILGFVVILGGVILAILTVNVSLGFLTSLASIVPNVASLLFFRQANNANKRLDNFYKELVRIASIYKATELTLTTPIETQDGYKELIIKKWLSLYDAEKT